LAKIKTKIAFILEYGRLMKEYLRIVIKEFAIVGILHPID
jgi:hypothetical protein